MLCTKYKLGCAVQHKRVYQTQEPHRKNNTLLVLKLIQNRDKYNVNTTRQYITCSEQQVSINDKISYVNSMLCFIHV